MAYNLCFICSEKIQRYFEFPNKKQSAAGTLCELLGLQLSDNTFTFGPKFQQAPYCPQCVSKMKEVRQMLNQLKELKSKIAEEKYLLENKLQKTCTRRENLQENLDDDEDDDGENYFHPFDRFREEVVKEIDTSYPTSRKSNNKSSSMSNIKLEKKGDDSSLRHKEIIQSGKRLKVSISRSDVKNATRKVSTATIPARTVQRRKVFPVNVEKSPVKGDSAEVEDSESMPDLDQNEDFIPEVIVETSDNDNAVSPEKNVEIVDDPVMAGFIDIVYGNDPPEVDVDQDWSDMDMESGLDEQEIFVDSTEDGKFQCPYAPVCKNTFDTEDRAEFLQHVRDEHEGKIPVAGTAKEHRETSIPPKPTTSSAGFAEKWVTCKFCSEPFSSLTHLKSHYASQHEDEEWMPGKVSPAHRSRAKFTGRALTGIDGQRPGSNNRRISQYHTEDESVSGRIKPPRKTIRDQECHICHKKYTFNSYLQVHLKSHQGKTIRCMNCGTAFTHDNSLRKHEKYHCKKKTIKVTPARRSPTKTERGSDGSSIKPAPQDNTEHIRGHQGNRYRCVDCGGTFANKSGLNKHAKYRCKNRIL